MNKSKLKKGSGSSRSKRKFSVLTDSWENVHQRIYGKSKELRAFHEYNSNVSGIDDKGFHATCLRYDAKSVSPQYANLFLIPLTFHVEVGFKDNEMPDDIRQFFFLESLEGHLNTNPLEICDYPIPVSEEDDIRDSYLVKNALWNEFCDEERHPKLHVLVGIHPGYFSKIHETVAGDLQRFAEAYGSDLGLDVKVNRITNRARLVCEILGCHKGRFFRRLGEEYVGEPL
jgi:hypothetical protein